jgi:G3E family GTPase
VDQIELTNVIVLNKTDIAAPHQLEATRAILRSLNADARIVEASHGHVPLADILDTGRFDFEAAHQHPLWFKN